MSRFKGALLAAGLLLSFAVLAAAAPKETPPFPIHPVRLHGVIRLPNGKPAVKQQVEVRVAPREEPYRLTPGRDGRYSLTTDNAGHVIEVLAPGVGWSKALPLKPRLAKREARLDIQLYPLPVLAGRVFLPDGRPATNVMLASYGRVSRETLLPSGSYVPPNMSYLEMSGGADILGPGFSTDRQGRYRIPLGRDAQGLPYLRNGSSYDVHLFSRAGKGWVKLTDLRLDAGPAEISKDLHLQRGDRIEGVVRGYPGGVPMVGVKVEATVGIGQMHGPGVAVARAMTDRTGRFRLIQALPPKGYELIPRPSEGYGQMEMQFDPPQSEKATARRVEIGLVKDYTIRGRVYGMDGNPLAARRIMLGIASFTPGHPGILGPTQSDTAEVTTGPDGSYELPRKSGPSFYGERSTQPHWLLLVYCTQNNFTFV